MSPTVQEAALREEEDDPFKILVVDDNEGGAKITVRWLEKAGMEADMETSALEGLRVLSQSESNIDCVVSDYRMPKMDGLDFLKTIQRIQPELPVIFFTGHGGEGVASEAMSHGLTDYILKQSTESYKLLSNRIEKVVERRREVESLWESQRQFKRLVLSIDEYAIVSIDAAGTLKTWNPGAERLTGYTDNEVLGRPASSLYSGKDAERFREILQTVKDIGTSTTTELCRDSADGSEFWARETISPVYKKNGDFSGYSQVTQEIPHRTRQVVQPPDKPLAEAEREATKKLHVEAVNGEGQDVEHSPEERGPLALVRPEDARDELGEPL